MTPHLKWGIAGVVVGLILLGFIPFWLAGLLIVVAIAIPAGAWMMLDESQRRRYRDPPPPARPDPLAAHPGSPISRRRGAYH